MVIIIKIQSCPSLIKKYPEIINLYLAKEKISILFKLWKQDTSMEALVYKSQGLFQMFVTIMLKKAWL